MTTARLWAGMGLLAAHEIGGAVGRRAEVRAGLTCDLVDDEDRDPVWFQTLADAECGAGGPEVATLVEDTQCG